MVGFLADNNACGQNLLQLVSMANSIISEIFRLKEYIPDIYRLDYESNDKSHIAQILIDFRYFNVAEAHEEKIEKDMELQELDNEICENYLNLLSRFYLVFESIYQYAIDLQQFINELKAGYYIQQTLESVIQDAEGKQLMCESLYIYGVMLLILDLEIPGPIRERLLISYYRYSGSKACSDSNIDGIYMLLRSTGYTPEKSSSFDGKSNKSVKDEVTNYPEAYFARFKFDENFINKLIGRLRCDDLYNLLAIYPHPDHRSTALSNQAAMLFICLYFSPNILHNQFGQMREIVDKFFSDNWIVSIYMGVTINLIDAWNGFSAAKNAIASVVETPIVKGFCLMHKEQMIKLLKETQDILRDGVLTDELILQNNSDIIDLIRQCNVSLRWQFIHTVQPIYEISSSTLSEVKQLLRKLENLVRSELYYKETDLFELLLNTSQLENIVKNQLSSLMCEKDERWNKFQKEALNHVNELTEVFAGQRPLAKIEKNPQLNIWFKQISQEIEKLNTENTEESGQTLIQMVQALEEVEEFHNLKGNMQTKQYLYELRDSLTKMIQIISIKENIIIKIQIISDFNYAWRLIDRDFTNVMQESIKKHPKCVIRLRSAFLKLTSVMEIPLMRINQAKSEDMISVSKYYSNQLANYIRKVLQIVPETMFNILAIIQLQANIFKDIPTRLEKEILRNYGQFDQRHRIAKMTHSIAVFSEGILKMKTTLVGVLELDPKQLLEDGIRKELLKHLTKALNLIFTPNIKNKNYIKELEIKMDKLSQTIDGYRCSFEYIQDYLNIHGLKILQEELTRIINDNVEKECNKFLRNKIQYRSTMIPIHNLSTMQCNSFIGYLANELLHCTDPRHTIYLDLMSTWYEKRSPHKEIIDSRFFRKMHDALSAAGLVGLDHLFSNMLTNDLKKYLDKLQHNITNDVMWSNVLQSLTDELESKQFPDHYYVNPLKYYMVYYERWLKVWPILLDWLLNLGHKQILRQHLAFELSRSSKCNAKNLESALETFGRSLLKDFEFLEKKKELKKDSFLIETNNYLMFTGSFVPLDEIFVICKNSHNIALFFFLFTIAHIPRLRYSVEMQTLQTRSTKDDLDGTVLLFGLVTVFNQYHSEIRLLYLSYLSQYVTALVENNLSVKLELSAETITTLHFMELYVRMSKLPRSVITNRLSTIILNVYDQINLMKN